MNVNLGPQWEAFVAESIGSGRYLSASEVVREGLRLLQEREDLRQARLQQLRNEIQTGIGQLDQGEGIELDEAGLKTEMLKIKTEARRLGRTKPGRPA